MRRTILFISFLVLFFAANAQNSNNDDHIDFEKKSASAKMGFHASSETNNYDILYHKIYWEVDPSEYYIKGNVKSIFKAEQDDFSSVHFDLIDELTVDSVVRNAVKLNFTHSNDLVKITLPNSLSNGAIDSVTVYYQGKPVATSGFTAFDTAYHNGTPSLWTLSEPYGAREWWPCKQSLTDKIDSVDIYVKSPKQHKVGSNGKLMFEKIEEDSKLTYWKHRYPIASYLVAIAVTNYEAHSHYAKVDEINEVEILNYVYPEDKDWAIPDAEYTVQVMEFFSDLFIPYPFYKEKYGHAQFGWGGGMEHQTMSFMKHFSGPLITHELAHQWFGDYVTCGSWQHIWINEGFAEFCESLVEERFHPDTWNEYKDNEIKQVLANAESGSVFVEDTTDVSRIFDRYLTYKKGGLILQLLRSQLDDASFFKGMQNYLSDDKIAGGFAKAEDFQGFIEQTADTNLTQFFKDWFYGEGYPKYRIEWVQDTDYKLALNLLQTTTHSSVMFYALHVPVLLKGEGKEQLVTLHNTTNNQRFELDLDFAVGEVIFDPNFNIIAPHPADINVSIKESENFDAIDIMPNPAFNILYIKAGKGVNFDKLDIIDNSGKQVLKQTLNKQTHKLEVNIDALPIGIYYLRVDTNTGTIVKRFVKAN